MKMVEKKKKKAHRFQMALISLKRERQGIINALGGVLGATENNAWWHAFWLEEL